MFDADRPILKSSQDRLNRSLFAKYLARCLLDHHDTDSLVVGLYGGWGVGKTSLINLILEELNFAASNMLDQEKPIILNFSPWSYSAQGQLIYSFFRRLSSSIRQVSYLNESTRIIYLLELYVSFFTHQPIPKPLRQKTSVLRKLINRESEEVHGWASGRDLTSVKAELNELLSQQKHKIIIMIDNISRLYPDEIRQIFQIVKSIGDYANTTYLLAFDKDQVIQALSKTEGLAQARALVEKVVQLPFEVPSILHQDIENIFSDRLKGILSIVPEDAWDKNYWADIYYSSLKYFFKNCRDITRYVNTLQFSYARVKEVVNPIDFFALTAIEIFFPAIYAGIRENKDLFTDLLDNVYILNNELIQKDKLRCDEILARAGKDTAPLLYQLLLHLFPRVRRIYQPEVVFFHSNTLARQLKRVCSPDLFDIYFCLSLQSSYLSNSEFNTLLSLSNDTNAFDQALTRLNQDGRAIKFLDRLDSFVMNPISHEQTSAIIKALLDNGDLFPQSDKDFFTLDTAMRIHRIIQNLLQHVNDKAKRFTLIEQAIAHSTKSLYIIVQEINEQIRQHDENTTVLPIEFRNFSTEQITTLQQLALEKIKFWANSQRLTDHPRLFPILQAWIAWENNSDNCQQFIREITSNDRGLIAFLLAVFENPIIEAMTKYEKKASWERYLTIMKQFIDPSTLEMHAKLIFEDGYFEKLREKEQLAILIFLDLLKTDTSKVIPQTSI